MIKRYMVTRVVISSVFLDAEDETDAAEKFRMHMVCEQPAVESRKLVVEDAETEEQRKMLLNIDC